MKLHIVDLMIILASSGFSEGMVVGNFEWLAPFLLWIGFLFVVLTLTWINVSRLFSGMHTYA